MKIAIIGAGAAGLMCACLLNNKHSITVFDKNKTAGKKLLLTGNGRCNLTNLVEPDEFLQSVTQNADFLNHALNNFKSQDTVDFFEKLGIKLQVENNNRVFPSSGKAAAIKDALQNYAIKNGIQFLFESNVLDIERSGDGFEVIVLNSSKQHYFDAVIIATGGLSFPCTGSSGDGYGFAQKLGHKIIATRASLCGLALKKPANFQGTSVDCCIEIMDRDFLVVIKKEKGSLLFTKNGVSGPVIYRAVCAFKNHTIKNHYLKINFAPQLNEKEFEKQLKECAADKPFYLLKKFLPVNIANWLIEVFSLPTKICAKLTKQEQKRLYQIITKAHIEILDFEDISSATITRGGIDISQMCSKTMQSNFIKNLYFIGEILDIDALSGGFNLQIAFSTAAACAKNIS